MKPSRKFPGSALAAALAAAVILVPGTAHGAPQATDAAAASSQPSAEDAPTTDDPSVTVSLGRDSADPYEEPGLPSADSWMQGETEPAVRPLSEYCEPTTTYKLNNLKNPFKVDWADSVTNKLDVSAKYTLTAEKSTEFKFHVSVKVGTSAEFLLFGKLEAEINAGVERTKKTTYGSTVTTTVKPHKTIYGDRGMFLERAGFTRTITYSNCHQNVVRGTVDAPYRQNWKLYYA